MYMKEKLKPLLVRFNKVQRKFIKRNAKSIGISEAAYIREIVFDKMESEKA